MSGASRGHNRPPRLPTSRCPDTLAVRTLQLSSLPCTQATAYNVASSARVTPTGLALSWKRRTWLRQMYTYTGVCAHWKRVFLGSGHGISSLGPAAELIETSWPSLDWFCGHSLLSVRCFVTDKPPNRHRHANKQTNKQTERQTIESNKLTNDQSGKQQRTNKLKTNEHPTMMGDTLTINCFHLSQMEVVTKLQPTTARRWKHSRSPQCDRKRIGMLRVSSTVPVCASQVNTLPQARVDDHLNSSLPTKICVDTHPLWV